MHISEGVLSGPVLFSGAALAAAGTAVGLKNIDYDRISQVGILAAAFFVASLVHVNVGPASVHLVLNGLLGIILGWAAFPAILVALALQAIFFQFGGITVLGINTLNHALPALACYYLFGPMLKRSSPVAMPAAFICGFLAIFLTALMVAFGLIFTQQNFWETASLIVATHIPVMIIEGIITTFCIGFLRRVHPVMIPGFSEQ
jgi:cobalt/nickel transport system permease protein